MGPHVLQVWCLWGGVLGGQELFRLLSERQTKCTAEHTALLTQAAHAVVKAAEPQLGRDSSVCEDFMA